MAGLVVFRPDGASDLWSGLKRRKKVLIHPSCANLFHRAAQCKIESCLLKDGHLGEGMSLSLQVVEICIARGHDLSGNGEVWVGREQIDQPLRVPIRQRSQEDCIYQAENRSTRADTNRQRA